MTSSMLQTVSLKVVVKSLLLNKSSISLQEVLTLHFLTMKSKLKLRVRLSGLRNVSET